MRLGIANWRNRRQIWLDGTHKKQSQVTNLNKIKNASHFRMTGQRLDNYITNNS
jgi:hypothetical protein